MQKLLVVLCAFVVSCAVGGCAKPPAEIVTPSGQKGHSVDCRDKARIVRSMGVPSSGPSPPLDIAPDWPSCFKQAGAICGARGYEILERHQTGMIIQCKSG